MLRTNYFFKITHKYFHSFCLGDDDSNQQSPTIKVAEKEMERQSRLFLVLIYLSLFPIQSVVYTQSKIIQSPYSEQN